MNFFLNKIRLIITFVLLILLIYTFYRSEIYWNGNKRFYYINYQIFFILTIFLIYFIKYVNQKIQKYFFISFFSVVLGLYLFEGYLFFKILERNKLQLIFEGSQAVKQKIYEERTGKKFDTRNKLTIFNDLKKEYPDIKVPIIPSSYLKQKNTIFPLSGISNSRTVVCNENGYYSFTDSDRYGFNNPNHEWDKQNIEYILIGDSFTYGACVNKPSDIGSQLRKLSNRSVINLGYGGNGPLLEYAALSEYITSSVNKVIWIYYEENDLSNLIAELKDEILVNYLNNSKFSQNLKNRQDEINKIAIKKLENVKFNKDENHQKKKFLFEFSQSLKFFNIRNLLKNRYPISEFEKILILAKNLTEKNGAKFYFVYLPEYARYAQHNFNNKYYQEVKKIINKLEIPFIDIHTELFLKETNPLKLFPFEFYGHFTPETYEKVSEIIFEKTFN